MTKVLIIAPDRISESMAGPGVRYWNFAKYLALENEVTLLVHNEDFLIDPSFESIHVKSIKGSFSTWFENFETIIIQGLALLDYPMLKKISIPLVIDLYDPYIFEILEQQVKEELSTDLYKMHLSTLLEQIKYGDYFICASEKQRDFWIGMLAAMLRINPLTYNQDSTLNNLIGIVPFGLSETPPVKRGRSIKGVIDGIAADDKVIIWWGGLWDWLDPKTLVKAMAEVSKQRSDIKCVIVGTKHPDPSFVPHKIVKEVIDLTKELKLDNKSVFFVDWVKYDERMNYLLESDVGVSLHFSNLETKFSFRTRILDYLWSQMPMIVTKGDTLGEIVEQNHIGKAIEPRDVQTLAKTIINMIDEPINKGRFNEINSLYYWSNAVQPLLEFCRQPAVSKDRGAVRKNSVSSYSKTNKMNLYLKKGMKLLSQGDIRQLAIKVRKKVFKRY